MSVYHLDVWLNGIKSNQNKHSFYPSGICLTLQQMEELPMKIET